MYMGFNMLDPVVGGNSERARKLRQAISIAIDQEEFISIFLNGRGIAAQGPIPPGIFGYREGAKRNRTLTSTTGSTASRTRKSIEYAKQLLAEAGYPNGIDSASGKPLMIYFDSTVSGVGAKARTDWLIKQFAEDRPAAGDAQHRLQPLPGEDAQGHRAAVLLGLECRLSGSGELPVPVLRAAEARSSSAARTPPTTPTRQFDRLFERMREMENGPERQALIDQMIEILRATRRGLGASSEGLHAWRTQWVYNRKPNKMANNTLKYQRIDPAAARAHARAVEPAGALAAACRAGGLVLVADLPAVLSYRRRERARRQVGRSASTADDQLSHPPRSLRDSRS